MRRLVCVAVGFGLPAKWPAIRSSVGNYHGVKYGAVEVTRTPDRRFRKPLLYPAELPLHFGAARLAAPADCDKVKKPNLLPVVAADASRGG